LQKTITWTKKFNKGRSESKGACFDVGLHHWKLKTLVKTKFTSKVILSKRAWNIRMP
jgi:hypothetical protein